MKKAVLAVLAAAIIAGCSSTKNSDMLSLAPLALAAGAGYVGYNETRDEDRDKQLLVTGAAAAGAYAVGKYVEGAIKNDMVTEFNAGYSLGTSNAAKTQYWIIQKRQEEDDYWNRESAASYRYYSFPGSQYDPAGVKLAPHDVILRGIESTTSP